MLRLSEILEITQELGDLVVGFGRKRNKGEQIMTTGDALRDMPTEYIEYRRGRDAAMDKLRYEGESLEPEQSEADKAIADGKPRWMRTTGGWRRVWLLRRESYPALNGRDSLVFSETAEAFCSFMILEDGLEILPYGEFPPPAEPEMLRDAPQPDYEPDSLDNPPPFAFQVHEAHGPLCPDCDSHTESRSMPSGIEQWCPVCNVKVEVTIFGLPLKCAPSVEAPQWNAEDARPFAGPLEILQHQMEYSARSVEELSHIAGHEFDKVVRLEQALDFIDGYEKKIEAEDDIAEGPMHPDMIRAELQKAMMGGYKVRAMLKPQFYKYDTCYKMRPPHTTNHVGHVLSIIGDIADIYPTRVNINILDSVCKVELGDE